MAGAIPPWQGAAVLLRMREKEKMKTAHARLAPSGAEKWMTCTGSIAMEDGEPDDCNEYTDEGTAAHALAAMCLTENTHPAGYIGRVLHVVNGVYWPGGDVPKPPMLFGHTNDSEREFEVDVEMAGHVNAYVQRIHAYANGAVLQIEQRVPVAHITAEEDAEGTADVLIETLDGELQCHDLKFGMGVKVFAANNKQLMIYLCAARAKAGKRFERYRAVIHQPRLSHLDEWDCDNAVLDAFEVEARSRAGDALTALAHKVNWIGKSDTYLVPSDKACQWCKAKAKCPKLGQFVTDTIGADFDVLTSSARAEEPEVVVSSLVPTDLEDLGLKLRAVDLIEDWCKAIRARVEGALIEHANSPEAIAALGHKLVQGRKGNRAWSSEGEVEALLKKMRVKVEDMYTFKLISPTKAETFFKPTPKRWNSILPYIKQSEGKASVAPADDNRPALVLASVADDFDTLAATLPGSAITSVAVEGADLV